MKMELEAVIQAKCFQTGAWIQAPNMSELMKEGGYEEGRNTC
jgi:hypothetical protein